MSAVRCFIGPCCTVFQILMNLKPKPIYSRNALLTLGRLAEQAERFQDVVENVKCIIDHIDPRLTMDERSLLSVAYKMRSNDLRTALRLTARIGKQPSNTPRQVELVDLQCRRIEQELVDVCQDVVQLLSSRLMPHAVLGEEKVFYLKMLGDYYRYLAESSSKEKKEHFIQQSLLSYQMAYKEGLRGMDPLHPTRLGVALNFAVFFHDCKNSPLRACHLAKHALDEAVEALESYKGTGTLHDSFVILQLLKDDLMLWAKEMNE